jgi:hypothetical protein
MYDKFAYIQHVSLRSYNTSVRIRVRLITKLTTPQPQVDIRMYGYHGDLMTLRAITNRIALV